MFSPATTQKIPTEMTFILQKNKHVAGCYFSQNACLLFLSDLIGAYFTSRMIFVLQLYR